MEPLIVFLLMHCGMEEAVIVDSPGEVRWAVITNDNRAATKKLLTDPEAMGARVVVLKVEGEKACGVST